MTIRCPVTQPMLSGTVHAEDLENVQWPVMVSRKIDGIRCFIHPELGPVTRTFKPLPNVWVRSMLSAKGMSWLWGMDGELVAVDEYDEILPFNRTQSAFMTQGGAPKFRFYVFDLALVDASIPFSQRYAAMRYHLRVNRAWEHGIVPVDHDFVDNVEAFLQFHQASLTAGFEGTMLRDPKGPYKSGRSTKKQGWLLKYKDWQDAEGKVIGFEELLHNDNPQERDAFDHAKRSSHKDNLVPTGTLGALILSTKWGELRVGTGFSANYRQRIWDSQDDYLGGTVTFKYQVHGMQDKPRFPVFKGFRYD